MNQNFWRNKRVLLTGHTGFKGSWLSLWLSQKGARVTGYALAPPTQPSLYALAGVDQDIESIEGDIRDRDSVANAVSNADPDIVLHLAAQSLVRDAYLHPLETFDTNVLGTANLLAALQNSDRAKAVVVVTSDKCYENQEWPWGYRENESMGGHDPYSASKGCAELVTASFRRSYFNEANSASVASARAGNVIGGGDFSTDRLVTDIVASIVAGKPVLIRKPDAVRPWQHVLEPLHGYLLLAEALCEHGHDFAEGWNFGPLDEDVRPVSWICDELTQRWGNDASWIVDEHHHPHEATYLKLDSSKARQRLKWSSKLRLETALDRIVEWHRTALNDGDIRTHTLKEIQSYEAL